jgi:hypothetical protein
LATVIQESRKNLRATRSCADEIRSVCTDRLDQPSGCCVVYQVVVRTEDMGETVSPERCQSLGKRLNLTCQTLSWPSYLTCDLARSGVWGDKLSHFQCNKHPQQQEKKEQARKKDLR